MTTQTRYREIPYDYTSLSDREIILRYFDEETLSLIDRLRSQRITGRSARMIAEIIGDIFMLDRNPYVLEDFVQDPGKLPQLMRIHEQRMSTVESAARGNTEALDLLARLRKVDAEFFERVRGVRRLRKQMLFWLAEATSQENIRFDPFDRVAHSTDATDWRVEHPVAVVYPDSVQELPRIIGAARKLGLSIIPRGGGTGLTAGAVPVNRHTIVVNTEKLNRIHGITMESVSGGNIPIVAVDAGAVTEDVIEYCRRRGFIFATDPTSAWASTIGGNIAENAGGKKCVQWGTAIDNLYSWRIVTPGGDTVEIRRRDHPYRKIVPEDSVIFDVHRQGSGELLRSIELRGTDIRKKGLGKDITNKALNGLPGIQKEGGDGIIASAQFVLYRSFAHRRTLCLEFFGSTMTRASKAILEIRRAFDGSGPAFLTALEHFDIRYVRAINYRNRSARTDIPQAVLLVDVESNDPAAADAAATEIAGMVRQYDTEAVLARDESEGNIFWGDRKNLGAIARHTNAFKLNEDIVIPLEALADFADFIERLNLDKELSTAATTARRIADHLRGTHPAHGDEPLTTRLADSLRELERVGAQLSEYRTLLHEPSRPSPGATPNPPAAPTLFELFREGTVHFETEADILAPLRSTFHGYEELAADIERIATDERRRMIIIATHMHAGDGNVHVNIPVHSGDYPMMLEAQETAASAMREAVRLGGVVSGEHGIGLTKLPFIEDEVLDAYGAYKREHDPDGMFNPGKLERGFPLHLIYTPSFSLLELEAYILEATDLERLSEQIASCVRCGKCKAVCCTQIPGEGMLYNPRNKILAVGQITEAVLYYAQTMEMRSFKHFRKLKEISDHCTACHKCRVPCPVKIDFGKVTLGMRELQARRTKVRPGTAVRFTLSYLWRHGYAANAAIRRLVLRPGFGLQRLGHRLYKASGGAASRIAPRLGALLDGRMSARGDASVRERLGLRGRDCFYSLTNQSIPVKMNVVYFPGCGSERLYPEISVAAMVLLHHSGVRTFLPPAFSCCGYPFLANAENERASLKSFENRVVFHRMADSIGSSEIDAVLVSCGTCREMLEQYDLGKVFRNAPLLDINEFLVLRDLVRADRPAKGNILYHEPCHTPLKSLGFDATVRALLGAPPVVVPECCGEAGTLSLSRPDISCVLRRRKAESLKAVSADGEHEILTTCPSCVAGLSKQWNGRQVSGKSLIVRVAEEVLGSDWDRRAVRRLKKGTVKRIPF
jgi:FAD/FMN-containing dehydrogenase/Fe-S oxidoreductase